MIEVFIFQKKVLKQVKIVDLKEKWHLYKKHCFWFLIDKMLRLVSYQFFVDRIRIWRNDIMVWIKCRVQAFPKS